MGRTMAAGLGMAVLLAGIGPRVATAQERPAGTVTGVGTSEIKRPAEYLRVQVDVLAKAKTLKEALGKLRERKQAAQRQLETMGAVAGSIEFGEPAVVPEKSDQDQRMQMMMMMAQNGGRKPPQKPKEAPPIVVACPLRAEIRLQAPNAEELLLLAQSLEEKVKAADLGGTKLMKQASAQDEEMAQEQMEDPNQPKRGEPIILYVSKVSEDAEAKALAEAFLRAKRHAGQLAAAAGSLLGPLHTVSDTTGMSGPDVEDNWMMQSPYHYPMMQQMWARARAGMSTDKQQTEAVGLAPTKVVYRVSLSASFELRRPPR